MEEKTRRRRILLSVVWGLFFFVCSLYWTFPYDRLETLIADRVQALAPSAEVKLLGLRPSWVTGVRLDRLTILSREAAGAQGGGAPMLALEDVSARVSLLGFLTGKLKTAAGANLLGGRVDADVALNRAGGKRIALKAQGVDLGKYAYLQERYEAKVEGKVAADFDLDLLDPEPSKWKGGGSVDLAGVKLLEVVAAGFPLPPLTFDSVHAEFGVKDGKATVRRALVKGAEIDEARLSGDVALRQQLAMSNVNLTAKLRPNAALEEQWGSMLSNFLKKKDSDGFYAIYVRGPLSAPKITK